MPDAEGNQAKPWYEGFARSITAISSTIAATVLVGFIGVVRDLSNQAPLIAAHMQTTNQELLSIKNEQRQQSNAMATLLSDYTPREFLRVELEKVEAKIRDLQVQQAVLQDRLKSGRTGG